MTTDVDRVVKDFQDGKANGDYSHAIFEMHQLQQKDGFSWNKDAAKINQNLHKLGFNDFNIVGTDSTGHLLTTSQDGKQMQVRDPIHAEVESKKDNTSTTEKWGNKNDRQFTLNADGSSHFEAQKGDRYWDVVKAALKQQTGKDPSNTDIMNTLDKMAKAQGKPLKSFNIIHPGDKIDIPMPTPGGDGTYKVQAPGTEHSDNDRDNVLNPPGSKAGDVNQERSSETSSMDRETGRTTRHTSGELNDNILPEWAGGHGTKFDTTESNDRNGNLISRDMKYPDGNGSMFVTDKDGNTHNLDNVSEVQTKFNNYSGNYESTVTTKDGQKYTVQNDKNGNVTTVSDNAPTYTFPVPAVAD
ncbi:MAG TPA: hypothetical protein V6C81_10940 [Planktothrix sp.]|jgi:hypothetical protein